MTSSTLFAVLLLTASITVASVFPGITRQTVLSMEHAISRFNAAPSVQESSLMQLIAVSERLGALASATRRRLAASTAAIQELEKKGNSASEALLRAHRENARLAHVSAATASTARLRANADYGPGQRMLQLATGLCVHSVPVAGTGVQPGVYTVCPFDNVTLSFLTAPSMSNKSLNAVASSAGDPVSGDELSARALGPVADVALWKGWVPHSSLPLHMRLSSLPVVSPSLPKGSDGAGDAALYYESVEACAEGNGTHRMWILLTCKEALLQPLVATDIGTSSIPPGDSHSFSGAAAPCGQMEACGQGGEVQAILTALHPSLPAELVPGSLNAVPAPATSLGWLELQLIMRDDGHGRSHGPVLKANSDPVLLHVERQGGCSTVIWMGSSVACSRRMLKAVKRAAQASGSFTAAQDKQGREL